jgi:hypothetical protein
MASEDNNGDMLAPNGRPEEPFKRGLVQSRYARILEIGTRVGLIALVAGYALYASGWISPLVPHERLPAYWGLPANEYLEAVNRDFLGWPTPPHGWAWLRLLGKSDFVTCLGVAVLAATSIACFLGVLPLLIRQRRWVYASGAAIEAAILLLAASGLLTAAGH